MVGAESGEFIQSSLGDTKAFSISSRLSNIAITIDCGLSKVAKPEPAEGISRTSALWSLPRAFAHISLAMSLSFDEKLGSEEGMMEPVEDFWADYVRLGNSMKVNARDVLRRLNDLSPKLFSQPEKMQFDILDVARESESSDSIVRSTTVNSVEQLDSFLAPNDVPQTRFISICAPNSIKPLKITQKAMGKILTHHNVDPQFLDLLMSFATGTKESEVGPGRMVLKHHSNGSLEMQYRLSYVEEVQGGFAIRQTGIFHRFVPNGPGNLWIFLNPRTQSTLQTRLEKVVQQPEMSRSSFDGWELIHLLVLSSYLGDWRWYLKSLSVEIERIAGIGLATDLVNGVGKGINTLQDLYSLQDKVLPLTPRLESTLATANSLKLYVETLRRKGYCQEEMSNELLDELEYYNVILNGHLASIALLEKRTQEILNLCGVAFNLKSQGTAVKINRSIWSLTKDSVDGNATVKLVTILTLIYLPASFIASILGMNLFAFSSADGPTFQVSKQFWVFMVLTIPLTLVTVGSWVLMARRRRNERMREREEQILAGGGLEEV